MQDKAFLLKLKKYIKHVKTSFHPNFENNEHFKSEFLKSEIRKFAIGYSKNEAKLKREKVSFLENKLENSEQNLNSFKEELINMYEE